MRIPANDNNTRNKNPGLYESSVFVTMSAQEFAAATGKKLNFFEKIYFKVIQRQVKRDLKKNPDLLISDYFDPKKDKFKFDLLWFVIASIIGPIRSIVSLYFTPETKKRNNDQER